MATFKGLNEDQQAVFLAGLLLSLASRASSEGFRPGDGRILDGDRLVAISRTSYWVASHLDPLLRSDPRRYRDDEFERELRNYAARIDLLAELEERLEAASRWQW